MDSIVKPLSIIVWSDHKSITDVNKAEEALLQRRWMMPYNTDYLDEEGAVITTYWGTISDDDVIKSGREKLASLEKLKLYRYALTDLSMVDNFDLTSKGIRVNADIASEIYKENKNIIVVFVLPTDAEYGMGRMWQVFGDQYGIKSFVCRTRDEAEEWIRKNLSQENS